MGQNVGKKAKKMAIPEDQLDMYIRSEFRAMHVDPQNATVLSRQQVLDLLTMLGYDKGRAKLKALHIKDEESVEIDDYTKTFLADKTLVAKTARYRNVFTFFDKNNDGTASKEEIINGLESMDIKVDKKMKETVEKMDADHDGKITYEEYLRTEFHMALNKDVKNDAPQDDETSESKE